MELCDIRHPDPAPGLDHIPPTHGFAWFFDGDVLVLSSTRNTHASWLAARPGEGAIPPRLSLWNALGGTVDLDERTVTICKESAGDKMRTRSLTDVAELQRALEGLAGQGVEPSFRLAGTPRGFPARTVGAAMRIADPVHEILDADGPLTLYHGTSLERWAAIRQEGLVPGRVKVAYGDLVPGYSHHNVYLATQPWTAEFYARRQARKDANDGWVVVAVQVDDRSRVRADDAFIRRGDGDPDPAVQGAERHRIADGIRRKGEVAYRGRIPPDRIHPIRAIPAESLRSAPDGRGRQAVPCAYLLDATLADAAVGRGDARVRGRDAPSPTSAEVLAIVDRSAPPGSLGLGRSVALAPLHDWGAPPPGTVAVTPPAGRVTRHDRSWLDEIAAMVETGRTRSAQTAARSYWAGSELHGNWEFLAPWVDLAQPSPAPEEDPKAGRHTARL